MTRLAITASIENTEAPQGKLFRAGIPRQFPFRARPKRELSALIIRGGTSGGDFSPGSPIEGYDHASSYPRQVLGFIGITDLDIVLAGSARAGMAGETAVEEFGEVLALAAAG